MNEIETQIDLAVSADATTPRRLYDSPRAPMFYPGWYFIRKLTMLRVGADGIPEVVTS